MRFDRPVFMAVLVLWAAPAPAIDLTGTWNGMQVCQYFEDGNPKTHTFRNDVVRLSQQGGVAFFTSELVGGDAYHVNLIEDAQRPADKAQGIFVNCHTAPDSTYQELGRMTKLQIAGGSAIFEGTSNFFQIDPDRIFLGTCEWNYRRVDTQDPGLSECPATESADGAKAVSHKGRPR
jgi:hypothetical protein